MKKVFYLSIAVLAATALVSCSNKGENADSATVADTATVTETVVAEEEVVEYASVQEEAPAVEEVKEEAPKAEAAPANGKKIDGMLNEMEEILNEYEPNGFIPTAGFNVYADESELDKMTGEMTPDQAARFKQLKARLKKLS